METYQGNSLDSSQPKRYTGKHREVSKPKRPTKLKDNIIKCDSASDAKAVQYCENIVTSELEQATRVFLRKITNFQESAFQKNEAKAKIKKRYIVGLHETKKYLVVKKVRLLIIATDLRICSTDDLLYCEVENLKQLAEENGITCIFVLRRSQLGNILRKHRQVSCVGILNYQSAENEFSDMLRYYVKINNSTNEADDNASIYDKFLNTLKDAVKDCEKPNENQQHIFKDLYAAHRLLSVVKLSNNAITKSSLASNSILNLNYQFVKYKRKSCGCFTLDFCVSVAENKTKCDIWNAVSSKIFRPWKKELPYFPQLDK